MNVALTLSACRRRTATNSWTFSTDPASPRSCRLPEPMSRQVIRLHPAAPLKPPETAPCNGCGVCCAAEPCPIGVLVTGRRTGACAALLWNADAGLYRCALVAVPRSVLPWLPAPLAPLLSRLARRWISAASGCDSDLLVEGHG